MKQTAEVFHGKKPALERAAEKLLRQASVPTPAELAARIDEAFAAEAAWGQATKRCFASYRAAGDALAAKKAALQHGEWMPWLRSVLPAHYGRDSEAAHAAWQRTANNWMRIAHILAHAHPAVIESAQTVAQLFRLAQMLPEGGCPERETRELAPPQLVTRLSRLVPHLSLERVRAWPDEDRAKLRAELEPVRQLLAALD